MRSLFASALISLLLAEPAFALPLDSRSSQPSSPWMAAATSGLAAPVAGLTAVVLFGTIGQSPGAFVAGVPTLLALGLSPLLAGSGQLYAGDVERAKWVGLGGPAVTCAGTVAGVLLVVWLDSVAAPPPESIHRGNIAGLFMGGILGYSLSLTGYSIWSATDAYQTTIRMNQVSRPETN